jgi:hypothetical protein
MQPGSHKPALRVRYTNYLGMPHGFLSMPRICSAAHQAIAEIAQSIVSEF